MTAAMPKRLRSLIVEDNPGDARLIREMLRETEGEGPLEIVEDLAGARRVLGAQPFDVVLLDLSLPDSHGIETVSAMRAIAPSLPIVVLTGLEDERTAFEALEKGAQDYLVKGQIEAPLLHRTLRYAIQRKRLEDELKHSVSLLQATLESTADGVLVVDQAGRAVNHNQRFVEMWDVPEDVLGAEREGELLDFLANQLADPERFRKRVRELLGEEEHGYDLVTFRDGRVYERLSIPYVIEGRVVGRVWSFRDVTERRRAIEDLRQARQAAEAANQAKSEFLADLNHEIRTPLSNIVGVSELLADTKLSPEQAEYVTLLRRSSEALMALVSDVLDLAKIEAGRLELEATPFALRDLVRAVVDLLAQVAARKGLTLAAEVAPDVPARVVGDSHRVRQVLINLINNAVKFTEQGGVRVQVGKDPVAGFLHFTVSDTGIGIQADELPGIFDEFRQADSSISRQYGGTGLGLAIARRLVERMGGRIWVESTLGIGSNFHFTIPLPGQTSAATDGSTDGEERDAPSAADGLRVRVLLADDSADNRSLIGHYLRKTPYELDLAENGEEAVRKFESGDYDIVIMDLQMPVLDGHTAVRAIRRWEHERGRAPTPILALTAYASEQARARTVEAGCDAFLTKPVTRQQLLEAIAHYGRKTTVH
jgi:two-component system, sensor histidine kinase and response regulator